MKNGLIALGLLLVSLSVPFIFFLGDFNDKEEALKNPLAGLEARMLHTRERLLYDKHRLMDPRTGRIPADIRKKELAFVRSQGVGKRASDIAITPRGPANLGGRTRAIAFDLSDPSGRTLLSGGVSSGVFRSTDRGASWTKVTPSDAIHSVTTLAQDPTEPRTWYYGTGEVLEFSVLPRIGEGIWKSTNQGVSWQQLESTVSENQDDFFNIINRIRIDPATGNVYAAVSNKLIRSTDGGLTWEMLIESEAVGTALTGSTDVVINSQGTAFYATFHGQAAGDLGGVWHSATGDPGSWTKIAGVGSETTPEGWGEPNSYLRVVANLAPSSENLLYVFYTNGFMNFCDGNAQQRPEADLFVYDSNSGTWENRTANLPNVTDVCTPGNNPIAVQRGYDIAVSVHPTDPNAVFIGGTNLYRSLDGFSEAGQFDQIGGYASPDGYSCYPNHHPDIHLIIFDPFNPDQLISATDGGVHETNALMETVEWTSLNNDYVTYQFYHIAISPEEGNGMVLGGAQDNGATLNTGGTSATIISGGDGASVGIGENSDFIYAATQFGTIFRGHLQPQRHFFRPDHPRGSRPGHVRHQIPAGPR